MSLTCSLLGLSRNSRMTLSTVVSPKGALPWLILAQARKRIAHRSGQPHGRPASPSARPPRPFTIGRGFHTRWGNPLGHWHSMAQPAQEHLCVGNGHQRGCRTSTSRQTGLLAVSANNGACRIIYAMHIMHIKGYHLGLGKSDVHPTAGPSRNFRVTLNLVVAPESAFAELLLAAVFGG
jgi:hypothetical protein